MGIRINKHIGYALRRPAEFWRAMRPVFAVVNELELHSEFLPWANENIEAVRALLPPTSLQHTHAEVFLDPSVIDERDRWTAVGHCVAYSDEGGDPEIVLLRPVASTSWFRRDDTIDYCEEKLRRGDEAMPHVEYLDVPIHPQDERTRIPVCVAAILLRLGIPELVPELREAVYTYWG